jgi:uncharacterized protein YqeY
MYNAGMKSRQDIEAALKDAIRSKDELKKSTLRMLLTAVKLEEVENRGDLDPDQILQVMQAEAKTRRETIEEALAADRQDIIQLAEQELAYLSQYLPKQLSTDELAELARQAIDEVGATNPAKMGEVMRILMPRVQGRVEGKVVSATVRELLSS